MENHTENIHQKLVPDPSLIFVDNPKQPLHARSSFKNKIKLVPDPSLIFVDNPKQPLHARSSFKNKIF